MKKHQNEEEIASMNFTNAEQRALNSWIEFLTNDSNAHFPKVSANSVMIRKLCLEHKLAIEESCFRDFNYYYANYKKCVNQYEDFLYAKERIFPEKENESIYSMLYKSGIFNKLIEEQPHKPIICQKSDEQLFLYNFLKEVDNSKCQEIVSVASKFYQLKVHNSVKNYFDYFSLEKNNKKQNLSNFIENIKNEVKNAKLEEEENNVFEEFIKQYERVTQDRENAELELKHFILSCVKENPSFSSVDNNNNYFLFFHANDDIFSEGNIQS